MDKKQIYQIGKKMNKPVAFIKKNGTGIISVISAAVSVIAVINQKNKK